MIFIDTNYFLRFLLNDNREQSEKVKKLFLSAAEGKSQLFTSDIVIFEIYWVLDSYYQRNKVEISLTLEKILALEFIKLDEHSIFLQAITLFRQKNFSFEDCYNLNFAGIKRAKTFATFDKKLAKIWEKLKS